MEKIVHELLQQARAIWRRRWWILPIAWTICLLGWGYVHKLPDVYQASARVYVDTQSVLDPLLRGMTVRPDTEQRLRMITRTLLSRDNLLTIARDSDLDILTGNSNLDAQVALLRDGLTLDGGVRDNIYNIRYRHNNPDVAHGVVRETVNLFMERGMGGSRIDLSASQAFIERQLENYEEQLEEKEAQIERFKQENARFISGGGNFYNRLESAREQLAQARLQERELRSRLEALRNGSWNEDRTPEYDSPELDQRIAELEAQIDRLRLRFTDEHPDVVATQRIRNDLVERREQEAERFAAATQGNALTGTLSEPLQLALAETTSQIASLQTRIEEYAQRVERLEQDVDRAPAVESELTALTRNYDVLRDAYRQLLDRRERAIMSGQVEMETQAVDFRVLDPPQRPAQPTSPNRPLLATGVLLLGLGAGTAFAFLLAQLRRTIHDTHQLAEMTGRPVLGSISRARTPLHRRQRRSELLIFGSATAGLLLAFGAVMVLFSTGNQDLLDQLLGFLP